MGGMGVDRVGIGAAAKQDRDQRRPVRIHGGQQRGAALLVASVGQRRVLGEQALGLVAIACTNRVEEPGRPVRKRRGEPALHLRAQRAPAGEAVLARDQPLGVDQAGGGIGAAELVQAVLGELLEEREVGTIGKRHGAPPFHPSRGPCAAWPAGTGVY